MTTLSNVHLLRVGNEKDAFQWIPQTDTITQGTAKLDPVEADDEEPSQQPEPSTNISLWSRLSSVAPSFSTCSKTALTLAGLTALSAATYYGGEHLISSYGGPTSVVDDSSLSSHRVSDNGHSGLSYSGVVSGLQSTMASISRDGMWASRAGGIFGGGTIA